MMEFSRLQKKYFVEIKNRFLENKRIELSDEENALYKDVLEDLICEEVIIDVNVDNANWYILMNSIEAYEIRQKDYEREQRKLSSREWKIAIISTIIGALSSWVLSNLNLICEFIK